MCFMTLITTPASVPGTVIWRQTYYDNEDEESADYDYRFNNLKLFPTPLQGRVCAKLYRDRMVSIDKLLIQNSFLPKWLRRSLWVGFVLLLLASALFVIFVSNKFRVLQVSAGFLVVLLASIVVDRIRLNILQTKMRQLVDSFNEEDNRIGLYWRLYFSYEKEDENYWKCFESATPKVYFPLIDVILVEKGATHVPIMPRDSSTPPPYSVDNPVEIQHQTAAGSNFSAV